MTDDAFEPPRPALPDEAQASLRDEIADDLARAQTDLETQLADLQHAGLADGNAALIEELHGQLHVLHGLSQFLATAHGSALSQIRAEATTSVAAAHSISQQAQTAMAAAQAAQVVQAAEYAAATARLDQQVAAAIVSDRDNDALAHAKAKRFGIDLSDYDAERDDLERQRAAAIASGDKLAERQADLLLAQNTYDAMAASADTITDSEERRTYLQQMQGQQRNIGKLRGALDQQLELDARQRAQKGGLSPEETEAAVTRAKAEGMANADRLGQGLVGAEQAQATQLRLEASVKAVQLTRPMFLPWRMWMLL